MAGFLVHFFFFVCRFATRERNALLLYNGRFNQKHDFIAVEIIDEQIQLTFSGGAPVCVCVCVSEVLISDKFWRLRKSPPNDSGKHFGLRRLCVF